MVPLMLIVITSLLVGDRVSPWVWPALVALDLVVIAFVGNYWANRDALAREERNAE